ncbi:MAG: dephospho-CoA kinase [Rikenellaceae bacterium]
MYKVGVTGGIGSGKSTLCGMFKELGIPVYNSDSQAKLLMASDAELREKICQAFGEGSYAAGALNRQYLAQQVFGDANKLALLNSIVHPRVKEDFLLWCEQQNAPYAILECAILFEANFNDIVDKTICVLSPENMRIERVTSRDSLTKEEVKQRMANQYSDDQLDQLSDICVVNFDIADLEDAAKVFDKKIRYEAAKG